MKRKDSHQLLAADQVLVVLLLLLLLQVCNARACESQKRVVIRMPRRELDSIEAEALRKGRCGLKREEIRHSDERSRCVCMVQALRTGLKPPHQLVIPLEVPKSS